MTIRNFLKRTSPLQRGLFFTVPKPSFMKDGVFLSTESGIPQPEKRLHRASPIGTTFPQTFSNTRMFSVKASNGITENKALDTVKVAFRTPITQLLDTDRPAVQTVVDAATTAIQRLKADGFPIDIIEHQVLTKNTQKANLTQKTPKAFRIERLNAVRASDVFIEIVLNKSLSLSGAVERGYAKAFRDLGKRLSPGERALVNEKFPVRVFQGFGRSIVVMHNGIEDFGGPLITTLYKQDPDTDYIYIKNREETIPANLTTDFPNIKIIDFTQQAMMDTFVELFKKLLELKQTAVNKAMANHVGLAPTDDSVYTYHTPKQRG